MSWPLAIAWCGGGPAAGIAHKTPVEILSIALRGLGEQLRIPPRRLGSFVEHFWFHDWNSDPFSRGAYSYVRVGGVGAARVLSRPVENTLFFAGEATHVTRSGTVEGAIATGLRAANQVDIALGKR